nr:hypothetical protein [uncultured Pedobacter sp.]
MNKTITNHLLMFEAIIGQILKLKVTEGNSIGIGLQLYCTFTELTEEVYNLLLGDPDFAAKEMEGGLTEIDNMIGECCLLSVVYSPNPVFDGVEEGRRMKEMLVRLVAKDLAKLKELFTDIKAIPDFKI